MSVHAEMPRKVNKVFAGQQLDPRGGRLDPLDPHDLQDFQDI
jgi:hypothetical protein